MVDVNQQKTPVQDKPVHKRPSWDEYFIHMINLVGERATCDRGRSGCVIVRDNRVLSTGYVGSPAHIAHCDDVGHQFKDTIHEDGTKTTHCVRTLHAEQNAICQAAKNGISVDGSTLYCKMTPCYVCAKLIIACGMKRVVAEKDYHASKDSKELFRQAGVELVIVLNETQMYVKQ